ncbi:hypothetical protein [Paeniglutamicibacter psychrophenolicus]|uniref:hypothetical protein n=1 Tax=Paeniglutamicibacter psychrophenolicus TaxID=257454 RepID=UPI00277D5F9F|nr:hypothetical protein [Paeniglutamicibacter psychrophenolicus]MDQ0094991.1 hypothetical protein [Paeniglutamicibacter psychrophenolicus]
MTPGYRQGHGPDDFEDDGVHLPPNVERSREDFARMKPDFCQWLEATEPDVDPEVTMGTVSFVVSHCSARDAYWILTEPSVDAVRETLRFVEDHFPDMLEGAKSGMGRFMEFLDESQLYSGSDESYEQVYELVVDDLDMDDDDLEEDGEEYIRLELVEPQTVVIYSSSLDKAQALAAMEALPFVSKARALLKWMGKSKEITASQTLRRKDIAPAAATLGEDAIGVATGYASGFWEPDTEGTLEVRSASEAPRLDLYWQMLRYAALVELTSTRVRPTAFGRAFLDAEPEATAIAVQSLATAAYQVLGGELPRSNGEAQLGYRAVAVMLMSGATETPLTADFVLEGIEDGQIVLDDLANALSGMLGYSVQRWIEDGFLEVGEYVEIPEVLLPSVATALGETFGASIGEPRP